MSWLTFLPCSLLFGALSAGTGIRAAGWIVTVLVTVAGLIVTRIARGEGRPRFVSVAARRDCADASSHTAGEFGQRQRAG